MNQNEPTPFAQPISAFRMEENGEEIRIYRFESDPEHIGFEVITNGFIHGSRMHFSDLKEFLSFRLKPCFQDTLPPIPTHWD